MKMTVKNIVKKIVLLGFVLFIVACTTIKSSSISPDFQMYDWQNDGVVILGTVSAISDTHQIVSDGDLEESTVFYTQAITKKFPGIKLYTSDEARQLLGFESYHHILEKYKNNGSLLPSDLSKIQEKLSGVRFVMVMRITENKTDHKDTHIVDENDYAYAKYITGIDVSLTTDIFDVNTGKLVYQLQSENSSASGTNIAEGKRSGGFLKQAFVDPQADKLNNKMITGKSEPYPDAPATSDTVKGMVDEAASNLFTALQNNP